MTSAPRRGSMCLKAQKCANPACIHQLENCLWNLKCFADQQPWNDFPKMTTDHQRKKNWIDNWLDTVSMFYGLPTMARHSFYVIRPTHNGETWFLCSTAYPQWLDMVYKFHNLPTMARHGFYVPQPTHNGETWFLCSTAYPQLLDMVSMFYNLLTMARHGFYVIQPTHNG
jgi:hypothetical protein